MRIELTVTDTGLSILKSMGGQIHFLRMTTEMAQGDQRGHTHRFSKPRHLFSGGVVVMEAAAEI